MGEQVPNVRDERRQPGIPPQMAHYTPYPVYQYAYPVAYPPPVHPAYPSSSHNGPLPPAQQQAWMGYRPVTPYGRGYGAYAVPPAYYPPAGPYQRHPDMHYSYHYPYRAPHPSVPHSVSPASSSLSTKPSLAPQSEPEEQASRTPFYPRLPWQSFHGQFRRHPQRFRKGSLPENVVLPRRPDIQPVRLDQTPPSQIAFHPSEPDADVPKSDVSQSTVATDTASSSDTQPTTPSSAAQLTPKALGRPTVASTPIVPALPLRSPIRSMAAELPSIDSVEILVAKEEPQAPKSWAELLRANRVPKALSIDASPSQSLLNGHVPAPRTCTMAKALEAYSTRDILADKVAFVTPRGLTNTGNMCYMNSVRL